MRVDDCMIHVAVLTRTRASTPSRASPHDPMTSLAATLHKDGLEGGADMGYIIAWLLGVPVTLLVLFWLFFGR